VEDEDDVPAAPKKKKKKPKKKKKKPTAAEPGLPTEKPAQADDNPIQVDKPSRTAPPLVSPPSPPAPAPIATSNATDVLPTSPSKSKAQVKPSKPASGSSPVAASPVMPPHMSTTSLDLSRQQTAQSAHSYLQSESLAEAKSKIKSRPGHGNLAAVPEKRGWFSKFSKKEEEQREVEKGKKSLGKWFSNLTKKTKASMHQLLGSADDDKKGMAPMKWEQFLKVSPSD